MCLKGALHINSLVPRGLGCPYFSSSSHMIIPITTIIIGYDISLMEKARANSNSGSSSSCIRIDEETPEARYVLRIRKPMLAEGATHTSSRSG